MGRAPCVAQGGGEDALELGDAIELEVGGIGILRNTIVAPHVPAPPAMPIKIL